MLLRQKAPVTTAAQNGRAMLGFEIERRFCFARMGHSR
jgi:hypothetical protein